MLKGIGVAANLAHDGFASFHRALNNKGQNVFPVQTDDGATRPVLATPPAGP